MQIRLSGAALIAVCFSSAISITSTAPINCLAADVDLEQAICAQPALLARDQSISARLD
ncbi:hypothetical protein [Massilia psychrophila]|nr:hypothetical protein [Massilia psychrophila]